MIFRLQVEVSCTDLPLQHPNSVSRKEQLITNNLTNPGSSVFTGLHYYGSGLGVHEAKVFWVQQISTLSTNPTTESSGSLLMPGRHSAAADGGGTLTFDGNTVQELTVATTAAANPGVVGFFNLQIHLAWRLPYPQPGI